MNIKNMNIKKDQDQDQIDELFMLISIINKKNYHRDLTGKELN